MRYLLIILIVFSINSFGSGGEFGESGFKKVEKTYPIATEADAARFLSRTTMGITRSDIDELMKIGDYGKWLDKQMDMKITQSHLKQTMRHYFSYGLDPDLGGRARVLKDSDRIQVYVPTAVKEKAQFKERLAYALSQIFVVSTNTGNIGSNNAGAMILAGYNDFLKKEALTNFKDFLKSLVKTPAMALMLSSINNSKEDKEANRFPDENLAREIMQLFTIGLVKLNPNGTPKRDTEGNLIPVYTQKDIQQIAKVFTGWGWGLKSIAGKSLWGRNPSFIYKTGGYKYQPSADGNGTDVIVNNGKRAYLNKPLTVYPEYHDTSKKVIFEGTPQEFTIPVGQTAEQDLDMLLEALVSHPNTAPFFTHLLIQRLTKTNPSKAYRKRVADVFVATHGNMRAVYRAILLDEEALATNFDDPKSGKILEPYLRFVNIYRAYNTKFLHGALKVSGKACEATGQGMLKSPTVFNFYQPDFIPMGDDFSKNNLVAPEYQLISADHLENFNNLIWKIILNNGNKKSRETYGYNGYKEEINLIKHYYTNRVANVASREKVIEKLNLLLRAGQMSENMKIILRNYLDNPDLTKDEGSPKPLCRRAGCRKNIAKHLIQLTVVAPESSYQY